MKVLIVDDSKAMRMIVIRTLRAAGYEDCTFIEAVDGQEGLQKARAEKPTLVLTDWNMPNMSGVDLVAHLTAEMPNVKCGMITSESSAEMIQQARDAGARFLISKPLTMLAMKNALSQVL